MNDRDTAAQSASPSDDELHGDEAAVDQVLGGEPMAGEEPAPVPLDPAAALAESRDRVLRLQAELENVRKRSQRELLDAVRYAGLPLMRDLLPVLDNVQRAIDAAEQSPDASGLLAGVKMVAGQLNEVLARYQCQRIEALHQPFDPHVHEAVYQQPSDDHPPGTVVQVVQQGYQLHDRVVRPAQVVVSTSPSDSTP